MEIIGYLASMAMGVLLGLIGGGGSILTVPILVYLFGVNPTLSTAYSLFIVGLTALVGSISHFKKGNVNIRTALIFGAPSVAAVFLVRFFVVPAIPETIFSISGFSLSKDSFILSVFALLMLAAAWTMIRPQSAKSNQAYKKSIPLSLVFVEGLVVGALTGLVGAGGGFLIIPVLVLLTGMPMKEAVGTSLFIITLKSLIGFLGDVPGNTEMDYRFLILFSSFAIAGILVGTSLSKELDNQKLKPAFGWFVLISGSAILIKELFM